MGIFLKERKGKPNINTENVLVVAGGGEGGREVGMTEGGQRAPTSSYEISQPRGRDAQRAGRRGGRRAAHLKLLRVQILKSLIAETRFFADSAR